MKKYMILALLATLTLFIQSCGSSGDDPAPGSGTNADLLKTWKASSVLENTLDVTAEFTQYQLTFSETNGTKNFTLVDRQGTNTTGTWTISTDEKTITLTSGSATITLNNVSISATQLTYTADEAGKSGTVNLSFTLIPA